MTDHDKARETVEHLRAYDARTATGRLTHRAADLITAQAERCERLEAATRLLVQRAESLVFCHHHGNGLSGWNNTIDGVEAALIAARAALSSGEDR